MLIELSQGLKAHINQRDYPLVVPYNWHVIGVDRKYAATNIFPEGKKKCLLMHRLIMDAPEGMTVDHINGNPLDNRRENLRIATNQENSWNRSSRSSSGYLGVRKTGDKWLAIIFPYNQALSLGSYESKEIAAAAFNEAAKVLYGEFAKLNNVPEIGGLLDAEILKRKQTILRIESELKLLEGNKNG